MKQKIKLGIIILVVLALIGATSAYLLLTPQYSKVDMSGYSLEVPKSNVEVQQKTNNYNTYDDKTHNLTIKSWAWKNPDDLNLSGCEEIGSQLANHTGQNCTYENVTMVNQSGTYTYYTLNNERCILVITSNNLDEIVHIVKSIKESTIKLPEDVNSTNITIITDINILLQNNTNDTNNTTDTQTTTKKTTSTKKSSGSGSNIKSEGTYKGVEYSLHQGGYPYYSPQAGKTYHSKKEEYNDMKRAIDSGIAD